MLSVEATGRNIEQAIQNALFELKAPREDCDIKILEEGGLFKKAKVLVSISPEEEEKYKKRELKADDVEEKDEEEKIDIKQELNINPQVEQEVKEQQVEQEEKQDTEEDVEENVQDEEDFPQTLELKDGEDDIQQNDAEKVKEFLQGLLNKTSLKGNITCEETKDEIFVNIIDANDIIGYRGEGLNAIQYLTNVVVAKGNRHAKRVKVDCDNYRQRREQSLIALAERMAKKVTKTHASIKLEPMTANERRIIHTALAENEFVETFSKGEEPHRYLIIKYKEK